MSTGLLALLDDVAAIAKLATASLDDVVGQAAKAGSKAAGVVIDDAAVTPRYVVGIYPARELPMIGKITLGSLKNKLIFLLPAALFLGYFAPWIITPLLMIGGIYLCYEGAEKLLEVFFPHAAHEHEEAVVGKPTDPALIEKDKVNGAVRTDFILSAEIMAITLASVPDSSFVSQAMVLAVVGIGITLGVYGVVALIVKADDAGLALARSPYSLISGFGRGLVVGMPVFLTILAGVGTAAMVWVGGGIIVHGLESFGLASIAHAIEHAAEVAAHTVPSLAGGVSWIVSAAAAGVVGLIVGGLAIPLVSWIVAPTYSLVASALGRNKG